MGNYVLSHFAPLVGLVYIAQTGGRPPTEFVLTELGANRAVFVNPRHDSPQRFVYELSDEGTLSASIGYDKGGPPNASSSRARGSRIAAAEFDGPA